MKATVCTKRIGLAFLGIAALVELLVAFSYGRGTLAMEHYAGPVIFAFAGMTVCTGRYGRSRDLWVGLAFVGWYVLSRILLRELYLDHSYLFLCNLSCAYLLGLPFAGTMDDGEKKHGLMLAAVIFGVGYGVLSWLSVLAALGGEQITLPVLGTVLGMDPGDLRLHANTHPNISACLFLIAISLLIWLTAHLKRRWMGAAALVLSAGLYAGIALTVSRTAMIQTSVLAAGLVFISGMRLPVKTAWKRTAVSLLLAAACLALVFLSFEWVNAGLGRLADSMKALAEETEEAALLAAERDIVQDLATMTGRTEIYAGILEMLCDRPMAFLTGMRNSQMVQTMEKYIDNVHAHNSFLQTLVNMGIPGLLMALWFAARALWASVKTVFCRKAAFADQVLAVFLLTLLVGTIPEPYLFTEYLTACNFPFFLVLGYVLQMNSCRNQA